MTAINKDGLLIVFALDKPLGSSTLRQCDCSLAQCVQTP